MIKFGGVMGMDVEILEKYRYTHSHGIWKVPS